jgi:hypothetical protein
MSKRLKELLARLTLEERNGAILEVEVPEGIDLPNQSAQEILGEVYQAFTGIQRREIRVLKPGSFDPVKSVRRLRDGK